MFTRYLQSFRNLTMTPKLFLHVGKQPFQLVGTTHNECNSKSMEYTKVKQLG